MPMFVKLADGLTLDDRIKTEIAARLRREYTPRHIPTGSSRCVHADDDHRQEARGAGAQAADGRALEQAAFRDAMADPSALDAFIDYARTQGDYKL